MKFTRMLTTATVAVLSGAISGVFAADAQPAPTGPQARSVLSN